MDETFQQQIRTEIDTLDLLGIPTQESEAILSLHSEVQGYLTGELPRRIAMLKLISDKEGEFNNALLR